MPRTKPSKPKPANPRSILTIPFQDKPAQSKPCIPPHRVHSLAYHHPLLLSSETSHKLLSWFDGIAKQRAMPWRKDWVKSDASVVESGGSSATATSRAAKDDDGSHCSEPDGSANSARSVRMARTTRAYEVLLSEIMLQQTRVSTVIPFYTSWLSKWPTVSSLALASQDEVLSAWKGLGYYSRATRLHAAAGQIVQELDGEIPADVDGLLRIQGVGRYTAGAVSSIAFGRAVPLVDGNVARVLSRQIGLRGRVKDKRVEGVLWDVARVLVEGVSRHAGAEEESGIPGRWNQGLMELGSTICTPKPRCGECPIQDTCRAYTEGTALARNQKNTLEQDITDIEDACTLCIPLSAEDLPQDIKTKTKKRSAEATLPSRAAKKSKQSTLDAFTRTSGAEPKASTQADTSPEQIANYCALFPARDVKKAVPTQDCLVCIIQRRRPSTKTRKPVRKGAASIASTASTKDDEGEMQYLIEQRPEKGLLAKLWQFPNVEFESLSEDDGDGDGLKRRERARRFVVGMLGTNEVYTLSEAREVGYVMHVFTHLKLRMWVCGFVLVCDDGVADGLLGTGLKRRWVDGDGVEAATLGIGMQRCWKEFLGG